jgi:hypothetical protein
MRESAVGEQMTLEMGEEKMTSADCHWHSHRKCNGDLIAIFNGWNDMEKKYQTLTSETTGVGVA